MWPCAEYKIEYYKLMCLCVRESYKILLCEEYFLYTFGVTVKVIF